MPNSQPSSETWMSRGLKRARPRAGKVPYKDGVQNFTNASRHRSWPRGHPGRGSDRDCRGADRSSRGGDRSPARRAPRKGAVAQRNISSWKSASLPPGRSLAPSRYLATSPSPTVTR
jgi:hypothetical protein